MISWLLHKDSSFRVQIKIYKLEAWRGRWSKLRERYLKHAWHALFVTSYLMKPLQSLSVFTLVRFFCYVLVLCSLCMLFIFIYLGDLLALEFVFLVIWWSNSIVFLVHSWRFTGLCSFILAGMVELYTWFCCYALLIKTTYGVGLASNLQVGD